MEPIYFGGDASDLGNVRRLSPSSFKEFVDQMLNVVVRLNLTHREYAALPKDERQKAKRVPYVVPCTFPSSPARRALENASDIVLLCLDIDDPKEARPYFANPETLADQLAPFNFAVHTTASSTEEEPRVRVFVDARIPLTSYHEAVRDIASRIGLVTVNKESLVPVQPMYRPVQFKGDQKHPLLIAETGGRPYTLADLGEADPIGVASPRTDSRPATAEVASGDEAFDSLAYLRPPVDTIKLNDAAGALKFIDPECAYPEWLEIAAALRHQFVGDEAEAAYTLFDEWSARGVTKYVSPEDTAAKWKSLRASPKGRVPVTIRTLLQRAVAGGWDSGKVKARCYSATRKWLLENAGNVDASTLLVEGERRIAATPLVTSSEEEGLLQELLKGLRAAGMKVSLTSLRKDLRRMRHAPVGPKGAPARVPDWAKGMCYITNQNVFLRPSISEQLSPEALDAAYGIHLLPTEDELKDSGGSMCARGQPTIRPRDYLLNIVNIPRAYDRLYDPRQFNDLFITYEGKTYVNTYARTYPEPDPLHAPEAGELFMRHINNLIAEPEYARVLVDFMAYLVQQPGRKIRWAVLLQGGEGCGKTSLAEVMAAVLGRTHVFPVSNETLQGNWNEWAYGHQLVAFEEIHATGQSRYAVMDKVKPLITNDQVGMQARREHAVSVPNCTNYMLFTNHHDAIAISEGDRRYFVLKSRMQSPAQIKELGENYFQNFYAMLNNNAGGLRAWFEKYTISNSFNPDGHAPDTIYRAEMITDSAGELTSAVRDMIEDSDNPLVKGDLLSSVTLAAMISNDLGMSCQRQQLARILREEGWQRITRCRLDGVRHNIWRKAGCGIRAGDVLAEVMRRVGGKIDGENCI